MDKEALVRDRISDNTGEVEIEGVGTITVRALSRQVFLTAQKRFPDDNLKQERYTLSHAMVDPQMTEEDIATWQRSSGPMEINTVADKVNELSGIKKGAQKSGVDGVRDES